MDAFLWMVNNLVWKLWIDYIIFFLMYSAVNNIECVHGCSRIFLYILTSVDPARSPTTMR